MFWKVKKISNLYNLDYSTLESSDAIPSSIQFRQYLYVSSRVKLRAIYLQRSMFRLSRKSNLNPQVGVTYVPTYKKIHNTHIRLKSSVRDGKIQIFKTFCWTFRCS